MKIPKNKKKKVIKDIVTNNENKSILNNINNINN